MNGDSGGWCGLGTLLWRCSVEMATAITITRSYTLIHFLYSCVRALGGLGTEQSFVALSQGRQRGAWGGCRAPERAAADVRNNGVGVSFGFGGQDKRPVGKVGHLPAIAVHGQGEIGHACCVQMIEAARGSLAVNNY